MLHNTYESHMTRFHLVTALRYQRFSVALRLGSSEENAVSMGRHITPPLVRAWEIERDVLLGGGFLGRLLEDSDQACWNFS